MRSDRAEPAHDHNHEQNRFAVIPTAEKLNADPAYAGGGVTIAFLDSGFYPHPDFASRVVAFHDISGEEQSLYDIAEPQAHHWHGTQTVAACAGDGSLSDGVYRGLAYKANLVLVKVSRNGSIGNKEIEDGLVWVIENRSKFGIRILNMSLGGDRDEPTAESTINQLVEQLIMDGVVVTVAAGNSSDVRSIPPASAPSAITVGGYSDENKFSPEDFDLYHSSHGLTADGTVKPELIAPGMYVAAPILPGTSTYEIAEVLSELSKAPDYLFGSLLNEIYALAKLGDELLNLDRETARRRIGEELIQRKIVATHYQHVDGTSFAAPIAASVVAQMYEANQLLSPPTVKNILVSTATRLGGHAAIRQGFGVLNARSAVDLAKKEIHLNDEVINHAPRIFGNEIVFRFHDDTAERVALVGDLNGWDRQTTLFERSTDGAWEAKIACQPSGKYRYKLLIDDSRWTEDPSHGFKEDDGLGGFNSLLQIERR